MFIFCLPSDIPPSGEPVSKSSRSKVSARFPKLSRSHPREPRSLEPQSGDLWPFSWAATVGSTHFNLFCDSFLAYIYNLSSWRDYSCINLNPEKRHSLPRVISWLTTLGGSNHFLKRIWGLFMRAQQTDRHFLCFVKLHCTNSPLFLWSPVTMNSLFVLCCPFFHVQFSVPERHGVHIKTIFFSLQEPLWLSLLNMSEGCA